MSRHRWELSVNSEINERVQIKIEQIARLRFRGIKDVRIAEQLGISYGGLQRILATSQYRNYEAAYRKTQLGRMDSIIESQTDILLRKEAAEAVPEALKFVVDQLKNSRDLRIRLAAAKEILDRDPRRRLVKQTRTDAPAQTPELPESIVASIRDESDKTLSFLSVPPAEA